MVSKIFNETLTFIYSILVTLHMSKIKPKNLIIKISNSKYAETIFINILVYIFLHFLLCIYTINKVYRIINYIQLYGIKFSL